MAHPPPTRPVTVAATTFNTAKGQPRSAALTVIESTPVCGVLIRKPTAAPSLAPSRFNARPAGKTPHEQSGNGTPKRTALTTFMNRLPPRWRRIRSRGTATCSRPASTQPTKSHGDSSAVIDQNSVAYSLNQAIAEPFS